MRMLDSSRDAVASVIVNTEREEFVLLEIFDLLLIVLDLRRLHVRRALRVRNAMSLCLPLSVAMGLFSPAIGCFW